LPIGFIPLIANPPSVNPDSRDFNVYKLINTMYNPPWNLQLVTPEPPSNDVVVELGKDHLSIELGDVGAIFPDEQSWLGGVVHMPTLGFGVRQFFLGASAVGEYNNVLTMNPALHGALAKGEPFQTNTEYALGDNARGQAAASLQLGWAGRVAARPEDSKSRNGVYAGARAKLLRGLAYGDAQNGVSFTTSDTLFSDSPIDLQYVGAFRQAGPDGGGIGRALDLGVVWINHRLEVGLGINDIASQIDWHVQESHSVKDEATGDYVREVIAEDVPFRSQIPKSATANASTRIGRMLVAADLVHATGHTTSHLGTETWFGICALRAGGQIDANQMLQYSGGLGFRLARFGIDMALATNSRNLSRERGLELGAGFAWYR
jgi:hypothetical protein